MYLSSLSVTKNIYVVRSRYINIITISMYTVNIFAILIATIISFGIGAVWYSPILFGKEWMELMRISDSDVEVARSKGVWKSYLVHLVFSFVTFCVLAFVISAIGAGAGSDAAFFSFIIWLGFYVPSNISEILWKKTPLKLVMIDTVNSLIGLLVGGAIIGAWN